MHGRRSREAEDDDVFFSVYVRICIYCYIMESSIVYMYRVLFRFSMERENRSYFGEFSRCAVVYCTRISYDFAVYRSMIFRAGASIFFVDRGHTISDVFP